jgi:hypothetical protein
MKATIRVYYEKKGDAADEKRYAAEMGGGSGEFPRGKIFAEGILKLARVAALNIRARTPDIKTDHIDFRNEIDQNEFDKFKDLLGQELKG